MAGKLRIARNALFLYARTIVCMVIGVFTVRVLLQALGVDDYGLYAVAGSLAGALSLLIGGVSIAVSRFITFEYGRGDSERMRMTFGSAFMLFAAFSGVIVLLGETAGLWVVSEKLVIPQGRHDAAMWVFQFGIATVIAELFQGPYRASVVARERFDILAGVEMAAAVLRLAMIYLISLSEGDRLIMYAGLSVLIPVGSLTFYAIYCYRNYPEARPSCRINFQQFKPVFRFASWEIVGMLSRTLKGSGFNMIVNLFCGVAVNAAIGIANTLSGSINALAYTVTGAFYPNMVKAWAREDKAEFKEAVHNAMLLSMLLYAVMAVPLIIECDYVLSLWLDEVPALSPVLCVVFVIGNTLLMPYLVAGEALKAAGVNRPVNIIQLLSVIFSLTLTYLVLFRGLSPTVACVAFSLEILINAVATFVMMARYFGAAPIRQLLHSCVLKTLLAEATVFILLHGLSKLIEAPFIRLIAISLLSVAAFAAASPLLLPTDMRRSLITALKSRLGIVKKSPA